MLPIPTCLFTFYFNAGGVTKTVITLILYDLYAGLFFGEMWREFLSFNNRDIRISRFKVNVVRVLSDDSNQTGCVIAPLR